MYIYKHSFFSFLLPSLSIYASWNERYFGKERENRMKSMIV